jgi:hypothetical protein
MQTPDTSGKAMIQLSRTHFWLLISFVVLLISALLYLIIFTGDFDHKTLGNLRIDRAKKMVYCYHNQFPKVPEDSIVRSVYFDYHDMMTYLEKMHRKHHATGIRIYFAKYDSTEIRTIKPAPCDPTNTQTSRDLKGFCTVVVIPTITLDSGKIVDLVVEKKHRGRQEYLDFVENLDEPLAPVSQAQNAGISCPPYPKSVCAGQILAGSTLSKADSNNLLKILPD